MTASPSHRCPPSGFASIRTNPASTAVSKARIGNSERKAKTSVLIRRRSRSAVGISAAVTDV